MTRAKFQCQSIEQSITYRQIKLRPVVSGSTENDEFFKTTPSGDISLLVKNEGVKFEVGKFYYVDFTECTD